MTDKKLKIAIIDDDYEWLNIVKEKLLKENNLNYQISLFDDFEKFYKLSNIYNYDVIITDFYFNSYNLDIINADKILKNFTGEKILITGNPSAVNKKETFDRIINKTHIMKSTFKFSKFLSEKTK